MRVDCAQAEREARLADSSHLEKRQPPGRDQVRTGRPVVQLAVQGPVRVSLQSTCDARDTECERHGRAQDQTGETRPRGRRYDGRGRWMTGTDGVEGMKEGRV